LVLWLGVVVGWGAVRPCSAEDVLEKKPNHVYICSFNIYLFGKIVSKYANPTGPVPGATTRPVPQRITNLAKVLAVGRFDLIAIQEVEAGGPGLWALRDLANELSKLTKFDYTFFQSDYIGRGFRMRESIAFVFNPEVIQPCSLRGGRLAKNIEIPGRDLVLTKWRSGDFDFGLVAAHLAWGNKEHRKLGYQKVEEILTSPASFLSDPDIIVLGDFNRFGDHQESVKELDYDHAHPPWYAPNIIAFDPNFNQIKEVKDAASLPEGITDPQLLSTTVAPNTMAYDIIFFTRDAMEEFPPGEGQPKYGTDYGILQYDEPNGFGSQERAVELDDNPDPNLLKEAYSDHRPVWIRFRTNAGHSDG